MNKYHEEQFNNIKSYIERLEKENNNLKEDFKRHIDRINELTNRINKVIEYIEKGREKTLNNLIKGISKVEIISFQHIIDILKGSDKE